MRIVSLGLSSAILVFGAISDSYAQTSCPSPDSPGPSSAFVSLPDHQSSQSGQAQVSLSDHWEATDDYSTRSASAGVSASPGSLTLHMSVQGSAFAPELLAGAQTGGGGVGEVYSNEMFSVRRASDGIPWSGTFTMYAAASGSTSASSLALPNYGNSQASLWFIVNNAVIAQSYATSVNGDPSTGVVYELAGGAVPITVGIGNGFGSFVSQGYGRVAIILQIGGVTKSSGAASIHAGLSFGGLQAFDSTGAAVRLSELIIESSSCTDYTLPLGGLPLGDADHDGVLNANDHCPNTPSGTKVDSDGCAIPYHLTLQIPDNRSEPSDFNLSISNKTQVFAILTGPAGEIVGKQVRFRYRAKDLKVSGHDHFDPTQPPGFSQWTPPVCNVTLVVSVNGIDTGDCSAKLTVPEFSGEWDIEAVLDGDPSVAAKETLTVAVSGLMQLPNNPNLRLVGMYGAMSCTGNVVMSRHSDNHWGSLQLVKNLLLIAEDFAINAGLILRINDMSLKGGGAFDVESEWDPDPHVAHRWGHNVDIDLFAMRPDGTCESMEYSGGPLADLAVIIFNKTGRFPVFEGNHYHLNHSYR